MDVTGERDALKQKLPEYALIAELIGGIVFVALLIFAGVLVHQTAVETSSNTRQIQAMTYQSLPDNIININRDYLQNPDYLKAMLKAQGGG